MDPSCIQTLFNLSWHSLALPIVPTIVGQENWFLKKHKEIIWFMYPTHLLQKGFSCWQTYP